MGEIRLLGAELSVKRRVNEEQTDWFRALLKELMVETRVVSVCLFFGRVEKDQGVWELDGVIPFR